MDGKYEILKKLTVFSNFFDIIPNTLTMHTGNFHTMQVTASHCSSVNDIFTNFLVFYMYHPSWP